MGNLDLNPVGEPADHYVPAEGESLTSDSIGKALLTPNDWQRVAIELLLSPRQLELIRHIFDGKKLVAVAQEMNLSLGTVKTYSQRIHRKLQVSDQRELTLAVIRAHLQLAKVAR